MTDQQHPIIPPDELVEQWIQHYGNTEDPRWQAYVQDIANQAAQWGADEQLGICLKWLQSLVHDNAASELRAHCRPKPKSQAEEALAEIEELEGAMYSAGLGCDFTATRAALERLRELEGGNA